MRARLASTLGEEMAGQVNASTFHSAVSGFCGAALHSWDTEMILSFTIRMMPNV